MKKVKMFEFASDEEKMVLGNFIAGADSVFGELNPDIDQDIEMQDPMFRIKHVGAITNCAMRYLKNTFEECQENQEDIFDFISYMMERIYGKLDEKLVDELLEEGVELTEQNNK